MHEMGIAHGVLAVVLDVAEGHPVQRIKLRVGALQQIEADSLQMNFQIASQDTLAADAVLDVQEVPVTAHCRQCGADTEAPMPLLGCSECGALDVEVVTGDEMSVDAVQRDDGWRHRPGVAVSEPQDHTHGGDDADQ